MSRVELAPEIGVDIDRILDHPTKHDVADPRRRIGEIIEAIDALEHNPMIGRPIENDLRELVIGRRSRGYVALYRYVPEVDVVFVLALRSQLEAGFADRGAR
ncbi:MAG TPA: type II toxin-antitoxin system RelE/ParE family toxin [Vicinamibacteria bacterium]|mgnify:CR=1 FL=1|nr:type II toxin-antitoxin system RelE/ParE family toxin [Vicinamibacteria bacterium]HRB13299.1 type II toxin-antitoxin system RelE/ParE family toxin [Vicinamibacteria bacterium]